MPSRPCRCQAFKQEALSELIQYEPLCASWILNAPVNHSVEITFCPWCGQRLPSRPPRHGTRKEQQ